MTIWTSEQRSRTYPDIWRPLGFRVSTQALLTAPDMHASLLWHQLGYVVFTRLGSGVRILYAPLALGSGI